MRVVHLHNRFDQAAGGIVAALDGMARAQVNAGLDVGLLVTPRVGEDTSLCDRLIDDGVDVKVIGPCTTPLRLHPSLRPAIEAAVAGADVIHLHGVWEQVQHLGARIAHRHGVPYLLSPHGMLDPYNLRSKYLKKRLYRLWRLQKDLNQAAAVHCTTRTEADLAAPLLQRTEPLVESLGVDLREFQNLPTPGTFRQRFGLTDNQRIVLFLSRIHAKKGLDVLVPAFAKAAVEDTVLVIAGPDDGGHQAVIEKLVAQHGLQGRVHFPGMLYGRQRIEAMVDAEVFALSSYQENFGIVVVESLASGTPVLISDQVNLHGEVTAADVGEVATTDVDRFADMIRRWMTDDARRRSATKRTRPYALGNYDWEVIARHWVDHYRHVVDRVR